VLTRARQSGFNVIEVVVTLAVLGLLVMAALPSMADWVRGTHVRNMAETTQLGLQRARTEAMKRNQIVTFWLVSPPTTASPDDTCALSSESGAWVVSLDNPAGKCKTAPSSTDEPRIVETYGPGAGGGNMVVTALAADDTAATSVSFNGYGQPVRTGKPVAKIDIAHGDTDSRRLRVEISPSGSIRMCDRAFSPASSPRDPRACSTE
jgi:type IV fimbrial biogenesis protein FimT